MTLTLPLSLCEAEAPNRARRREFGGDHGRKSVACFCENTAVASAVPSGEEPSICLPRPQMR
jgi:hypothetical protein